ncbi:serine hydrolase [Hymenobacter koreensis]|uniref:Beta-lactamase class A catalytic domain-containing protein n=1 Tax=Hymenobacter koreensis TaxID=1084523 RepID=A0ABP8J0M0_9BACT
MSAWGRKIVLILLPIIGPLSGSKPIPSSRIYPSALNKPSVESIKPTFANPLDSILRTTAALASVVRQPDKYELQVIYTRINRDAQRRPIFTQYSHRLNERAYFNPASLVKLPVAVLALEKLNRLRQYTPQLTRASIMVTGAAGRCQTPVPFAAPPDSDRVASVGNYIKRMLLVSDNQAYNRLYEFLGQQYLHGRLVQLGLPRVRITRRFAPCDTAANRCTNPISFYNATGTLLYTQPAACNPHPLAPPLGRITKGRAYQVGGKIVLQPYDFTTANYLPLQAVNDLLQRVLFPEVSPGSKALQLSTADYAFLQKYLGSTPAESGFKPLASRQYFPAYKKYLYYGRQPKAESQLGLRIYNIVGMSHGFLSDCAYFSDSKTGVEFMLSAVLYVNSDETINDGKYEYQTTGLPFLSALGKTLYAYEKAQMRLKAR